MNRGVMALVLVSFGCSGSGIAPSVHTDYREPLVIGVTAYDTAGTRLVGVSVCGDKSCKLTNDRGYVGLLGSLQPVTIYVTKDGYRFLRLDRTGAADWAAFLEKN